MAKLSRSRMAEVRMVGQQYPVRPPPRQQLADLLPSWSAWFVDTHSPFVIYPHCKCLSGHCMCSQVLSPRGGIPFGRGIASVGGPRAPGQSTYTVSSSRTYIRRVTPCMPRSTRLGHHRPSLQVSFRPLRCPPSYGILYAAYVWDKRAMCKCEWKLA